jgi:ribosomal protein S16
MRLKKGGKPIERVRQFLQKVPAQNSKEKQKKVTKSP